MSTECKKCPYFMKEKDKFRHGLIILGFCKLRQKYVTDMDINKPLCKERAVITLPEQPE